MSDRLVLDSQAVLAYLQNEPGAARVRDVLTNGEPWMTLVNLGEVIYVLEREQGREVADAVYRQLLTDDRLPSDVSILWVPVDAELVRRVASIKARGGLSYADCFAAAAAERLHCPILTADREFMSVEQFGIAVEWLA